MEESELPECFTAEVLCLLTEIHQLDSEGLSLAYRNFWVHSVPNVQQDSKMCKTAAKAVPYNLNVMQH
jgi:hypothetical protein